MGGGKEELTYYPPLIYYKPPLNKYWGPFTDIVSGVQSKEHHDWEQSVVEAHHYIKALCPRNGVLLDPMLGSATTIVAGLQSGLGLKCIGIEVDGAAYSSSEIRVRKVLDGLSEKKDSA